MKKAYNTPELKKWGKVTDLTETGGTHGGGDDKGGSKDSQGI